MSSVGRMISLLRGRLHCDLWKRWIWRVDQQLVSLVYLLPALSVRKLQNMFVEIEYVDLGWMTGVSCHHFQHYKDSVAMMYRGEKDVIIASNGALCVQRQHAPPHQEPTSPS